MVSKKQLTLKQLAIVGFFFATLFLLLGLFLSTVNPVNAQTGATGTATSSAGMMMGTATGAVPVTGSAASRSSVDLNTLQGFTVVDKDGNKVGSVSTFVVDLRNAAVCAPASGSTSMTAMATGTVTSSSTTSGTFTGISGCNVTTTSQTSGLISYVVVSRSAVSSGAAGSATAVATSMTSSSFTGDNVVIPWRVVRVNLDEKTLIVNAPACVFSTAPGYDPANPPDLFTGAFAAAVQTFWANPNAACTAGVPVTGGLQATTVGTTAATTMATEMATSTVAPTVESTSTSTAGGVVATTAPTTSGVVATTAATATEVASPTETTMVATPSETAMVASPTVTGTSAVGGAVATGTATVPATLSAPVAQGSPTALVPVTGIDFNQVREAAVAQRRMILDIGIVGVGLVLLALGMILKTGKH